MGIMPSKAIHSALNHFIAMSNYTAGSIKISTNSKFHTGKKNYGGFSKNHQPKLKHN